MRKELAYLTAVIFAVGLTGCAKVQTSVPELLEPVGVQMDVQNVQTGDIFDVTVYEGEMVPYVEEIAFGTDGVLEEMQVTVGDTVKKGDVLAVLDVEDSREQAKKLEEEVSDIATQGEFNDKLADSDIEIAKLELQMMRERYATEQECRVKEIEIQQLMAKKSQSQQLSELEIREKNRLLEGLYEILDNNTITAPCDGRVLHVEVTQKGDAVQTGTPVIYIADESRLTLKTDYVSEQVFSGADRVTAKIGEKEYSVSYVPYEGDDYFAMVLSGTDLWTRFQVEDTAGELEAGQFGVVMVYRIYHEDVVKVPANAIYKDGSTNYVYVIEDGQRMRRDVTVGFMTDAHAEIKEGLVEGDTVYVRE